MAKLFFRRRFRRVLIDVDTQYDLIFGQNQVSEDILRNIRRLMAWSRVHHAPVISTALANRAEDAQSEAAGGQGFCIEGTPGQKKIRYTMLQSNISYEAGNRMDLPPNLLKKYHQVIFEKRSSDPFVVPRADRMLTELKADEFVVFGIGLDTSIRATVLGLLTRGKRVAVVRDAVNGGNSENRELNLRKLEAKGAKLIKTSTITGHSHLKGKATHTEPWHTSMLMAHAQMG